MEPWLFPKQTRGHICWRGRIRACNGVLTLPAETVAAFDADLPSLLAERFLEPMVAVRCALGESRQGLQGPVEVPRAALKIRRSKPLGQHRATLLGRVVLHGDG